MLSDVRTGPLEPFSSPKGNKTRERSPDELKKALEYWKERRLDAGAAVRVADMNLKQLRNQL